MHRHHLAYMSEEQEQLERKTGSCYQLKIDFDFFFCLTVNLINIATEKVVLHVNVMDYM